MTQDIRDDQGGHTGASRLAATGLIGPSGGIPSAGSAWLDVSEAVLREALLLPPGCKILDAICGGNGIVGLLVEHEAIHREAMRVRAVYEKDRDGPRFVDWVVTAKRAPAGDA